MTKILIALSSGARPQYKNDILRALGAPESTQIQFRYDTRWVDNSILKNEDNREGTKVIICYIDQTSTTSTPTIYPVRVSTLKDFAIHGKTITMKMELGNLAYVQKIKNFQKEIASKSSSKNPDWAGGSLKGCYLFSLELDLNELTCEFDDKSTWHCIVEQLQSTKEFSDDIFYRFNGIEYVGEKHDISPDSNSYFTVRARSEFEFKIYHYSSHDPKVDSKISVISDGEYVRSISPTSILLESRYDEKTFRFTTGSELWGRKAAISCQVSPHDSEILFFDLPIKVTSDITARMISAIVFGLFIVLTNITASGASFAEPSWSHFLLSWLLASLAGLAVSTGAVRLPRL